MQVDFLPSVERLCEDLQVLLELTPKKRCPFHYRGLECKSTGVTSKFGLGVQNKAWQRLIEFCQENALVIAMPSSNNTREDSTHGHCQMVDTKIRLTIFFAKMEKLYTVSKTKTRS